MLKGVTCNECGAYFETKEQRTQHKKQWHEKNFSGNWNWSL